MVSTAGVIRGLVGVYHADGGLRGELAYVVGKLRGTAECALCDITHGALGRKREWRELLPQLGVPVDLVHLNERTAEVCAASEGRTPCVLAMTGTGPVPLLGPADLAALDGSVARFAARLRAAADEAGLRWAATTTGASAPRVR
ncbi:hypothetical protein GA0070616_4242 [Micromonospora nigra]|uniref:Uncharacterized protein n=1 Tax=Micromonospora nigra TaxID=145857 RepID=A0A1C6SPD5_9ACTN|nr:hypothetical protein [Micromonospora nigra]SCL31317.1 hypothetical protein GA0070616_4242 [Micromonospora nigra]